VDRHLFQQAQDSSAKPAPRATLAPVKEEVATFSPEVVELTEPDTPPCSQNKPKLTRRMPSIAVDVDVQARPAPVSESPAFNVGLISHGQRLGAPSGIPLPTSVGPLVLPKGPEFVAAPQLKVNLDVVQAVYTAGTRPVGPQVSNIGHLSTSHLPIGMVTQPAQAYQSLAPLLVPTSVQGSMLSASVAPTCVVSTMLTNVATLMPSTSVGADSRPTYVILGVPLTSAPPMVDTKAVSIVAATASAPPPLPPVSQDPGTGGPIPSSGTVSFVAVPPAPTVIIKQPEPVRPYTGQSSYKAYNKYFKRICLCNEWKSPTECARHLLVVMDGAATDAIRGLKAEKDTDLALICEALSRRFGHVDEPELAMRRFGVRRQQDGETLTLFEQNMRILHREAWPKTDIKSPEADSLLRRKFVDGIADIELQKYLRLHAANDDFAKTVSKARQLVDANELSRTAKKPAIRSSRMSIFRPLLTR